MNTDFVYKVMVFMKAFCIVYHFYMKNAMYI